jgi:preprotein translocase subunit SecG
VKGLILLPTLIVTILQLLSCVALILVVLLQTGKTAGLSGVIGGGSETYLSRNKAKTLDAKLARATKWIAIVFVVLTLALSIF